MAYKTKKYNEDGSAIIWILIAVGLFAALGFAFSSSSRTSTSLLTSAEAESYANQIIAYGNEVKSAVKRLRLRGCDNTEISFENNIVAGYTNANAPTNKSCHVFNIAGGGLQYKQPSNNWIDSSFSGSDIYNEWIASGVPTVPKIGQKTCSSPSGSCSDLTIFLPYTTKEVCIKINDALGVNNPSGEPWDEVDGICLHDTNRFSGSYGTGGCGINGHATVNGKNSACIKTLMETPSTNGYVFYTVLIARE